MYRNLLKPLIDFFFALFILLISTPFFIITTIVLAIINKGNPFFVQPRPGKHGKIFNILKFKTMTDERDASGQLLPDEKRLTRFGGLVRKTSVDELPQLINVIKGEMSIIGPRPLLVQYLSMYNPYQKRRHEVKPGITGLAQVNGRNAITWDEKFNYDVYYVDHVSFSLDLKILIMTIKNVLQGKGVSQQGQATVEYFGGNK